MDDLRTYCKRCADDLRRAKYVLVRTKKENKAECDKCNRQGYEYLLKKKY